MLTTVCRFRWAACQLDALAGCLTRGKVSRALKELPRTLDETYARILQAIDRSEHAEEALKILIWLTYAERPLTTTEVLQVTGIMIEDESRFDEDEVLKDPNDIQRICSSLVSVVTGRKGSNDISDDDMTEERIAYSETDANPMVVHVRLAHFSVKEYLVSDRPCVARYRLCDRGPHDILTKCCLVYLLRFQNEEWQNRDCEIAFPLARYAARYWTHHARMSSVLTKQQENLTIRLFTQSLTAFFAWTRFFDISQPWDPVPDIRREPTELPTPLFAASKQGIVHAVDALLKIGCADINAQWGDKGNALQASSREGYGTIVEMLLANGADVNVQGGEDGSALYIALSHGHEKIVEMLLAKGANVNTEEGKDGSALHMALARGYDKIAEMLLAKGANVNAGGKDGSALQIALARGYDKIVEMLLAKGANVDAQGGYHDSPLCIASSRGYDKIAEMLLAKGANVDAQGSYYGSPLCIASSRGYDKIVEMLLAKGANVNTKGGAHGSALHMALSRGYDKIVQMLIAKGADFSAQESYHGSALCAAAFRGYNHIVEMLLAKGADVNAHGGYSGSALQTASIRGYDNIVEMLLAKGADVNAQEGFHGSALYAASIRGYEKIVKMLVDAGADVNAHGGRFGPVMCAASERGYDNIVKLLVQAGAGINSQKDTSATTHVRQPRDGDFSIAKGKFG